MQRMLVVFGEVIGDAGEPRVHVGAAQFFGRHLFARRGLHQRRTAEKNRARAFDDDRFVGHGRHVRAARRARAHDDRDLRNALRGHPRLVVEDAPEMLAIGEDLGLQRQERAAGIDEIHAGQPVLERDLLRAHVLLDRHREVGAAFDRGVVGDDQHFAAGDAADAGDDAGRRRFVVVQVPGRQRRQLEKRRAGVEQLLDPLAHRQLALLAMALDVLRAAALAHAGDALAQFGDERRHAVAIGAKQVRRAIDVGLEDVHLSRDPGSDSETGLTTEPRE